MIQKISPIICFLLFYISSFAQWTVVRDTVLMGSQFNITLTGNDSISINRSIDHCIDEIIRIEKLISEWQRDTYISEVNQNAGIRPVKVSEEVRRRVQRALFFSEITEGCFDISIAAMDRVWYFDGSMNQLPTDSEIVYAIRHVNYKNIIVDTIQNTIFLKEKGMKIGLGATGKGYAAQKAAALMKELGIAGGIINASGDLFAWGTQPSGAPWRIGIHHPYRPYKSADILKVKSGAMTTSGDYLKYVEIEGVRYSHIIHPKTGIPVSDITSVTVIGPDAEIANGFSTSIMVLGVKEGLQLLRTYKDYACLIITNKGKIIKSRNYRKVKRMMR